MADLAADRNLLFGLLALQNGLINQFQLVAGFQAWIRNKSRPLADHLVARGDLDERNGASSRRWRICTFGSTAGAPRRAWPPSPPGEPPANRSPGSATPTSMPPSPTSVPDRTRPGRTSAMTRTASDARRHSDVQRPAVPRAKAARPRGLGAFRRARCRARPRGGTQANPRRPSRRPGLPPAVPPGSQGHRWIGAPRYRPGLRARSSRRRAPVLRHAVHPRRQPQGGHRGVPRDRH